MEESAVRNSSIVNLNLLRVASMIFILSVVQNSHAQTANPVAVANLQTTNTTPFSINLINLNGTYWDVAGQNYSSGNWIADSYNSGASVDSGNQWVFNLAPVGDGSFQISPNSAQWLCMGTNWQYDSFMARYTELPVLSVCNPNDTSQRFYLQRSGMQDVNGFPGYIVREVSTDYVINIGGGRYPTDQLIFWYTQSGESASTANDVWIINSYCNSTRGTSYASYSTSLSGGARCSGATQPFANDLQMLENWADTYAANTYLMIQTNGSGTGSAGNFAPSWKHNVIAHAVVNPTGSSTLANIGTIIPVISSYTANGNTGLTAGATMTSTMAGTSPNTSISGPQYICNLSTDGWSYNGAQVSYEASATSEMMASWSNTFSATFAIGGENALFHAEFEDSAEFSEEWGVSATAGGTTTLSMPLQSNQCGWIVETLGASTATGYYTFTTDGGYTANTNPMTVYAVNPGGGGISICSTGSTNQLCQTVKPSGMPGQTVNTVPTFTLAAPSAQAVAIGQAGGYAAIPVSVTSVNSFNSPVQFSVSGLGDFTAFLYPGQVTPAANGSAGTMLFLATPFSEQPGPYTGTITATSGSITQTTTIQVTVVAPTFTISTTGLGSEQLIPGYTAVPIMLQGVVPDIPGVSQGWSGTVTLTVYGLPDGVTASINGNPPGTPVQVFVPVPTEDESGNFFGGVPVSLTLTASPAASPASVYVTVNATSGGVLESLSKELAVTSPTN
jgi:hypothetical protein